MRIEVKKNIHFTKLVKVNGRLKEFNFRKLGGHNEGQFTVDVSDDRGNRILFRMQKEQEAWKILPQQLPNWVIEKETTFHDLIEEELRSM
ncbi:hypothetical protein [Longitalea arenae]|uniref:hypothetical protein n=1 Tax=Longitalea arenae TaxID=2812558 RepID=UPI00196760DF|nr:hypothetical protein [Longitalea arenae]